MNSKQIDTAMKDCLPVMFDGKRYDRIAEYISFYDDKKQHHLSVVLIQGRTSYRVPADKVELAERG